MKSPIIIVAVICVAVTSLAASSATAPSSQPSTRPATAGRAQRIRPDAPDAVKRLADYSFQYQQQIAKKQQEEWNAAKAELDARIGGKIDATKSTARVMHVAPKKGTFYTWTFKSGTEKRMAIEEQQPHVVEARAAWEAAKADASIVLPSLNTESNMIEVGWIGRVPDVIVEDIIDEHTVRARIPAIGASAQVYGTEGPRFIITGADTSNGKIKKQLAWQSPRSP